MAGKISPEIERGILSGAFSKDGIVIKYGLSDDEFDDYCKELVRSGALEIGQFERLTGRAGRPAFPQGLQELSDTKHCPYCAEDVNGEPIICRFWSMNLGTGRQSKLASSCSAADDADAGALPRD